MDKKKYFLQIFKKAEKKYGKSSKRLAAEGWQYDWQILIATILSSQSRDETTIPIAGKLFKRYPTISKLANAKYKDVFKVLKKINYNKTKAKNVTASAKKIVNDFNGNIPDDIGKLLILPGVGRKTANLVLAEVHNKDGITVDTHVHRISNVLGFVKTKNPYESELALMKIAPKKYWARINRIFVLWGKDVPGRDKKRLLKNLEEKSKC